MLLVFHTKVITSSVQLVKYPITLGLTTEWLPWLHARCNQGNLSVVKATTCSSVFIV